MTATLSNLANKKMPKSYAFIVQAVGLTTVIISILVLFGWVYDIATLKCVIPKANTMKVNTAVGFLFTGLSLLFFLKPSQNLSRPQASTLSPLCAGVPLLIGLLTLIEHISGVNLGIDELVMPGEPDPRTTSPGRMSIMTAFSLALLGTGLLAGYSQFRFKPLIVRCCGLTILFIASIALLGYLYLPNALHKVPAFSSMALHTAFLFALLSISLLLSHSPIKSEVLHYVSAAFIVAAAFALRLLFSRWVNIELPPFITLYPAILLTALVAGSGPGIFATALSAFTAWLSVYVPLGQLTIANTINNAAVLSFFAFGIILSAGIELHHAYRRKAEHYDRERALRQSKAAFRAMFEISSVGMVLADPETGRFLRVNRAYCQLTGYTEAELLQRTFMDITDPRDREDDVTLKDQYVQGKIPFFERETRYIRPDGTIVWAHVTLNLIKNEAGVPVKMVGVMQNISARKQAEVALREREYRLKAIIDNSPSALSLKHPDGRYALANPNLQRIHHMNEEQIIGKTDFDLYPEATARDFQANDRLVLETMTRHSIEEVIPVDGMPRVYASHRFPVLDDAGRVEFICCISLDITDRKLAEDKLRESEFRFRQVTESLPQMIWTCRADGYCDYLSPQWCRYTGLPEAPQLGSGWLEQVHPDDRERVYAAWLAAAPQASHYGIEYRVRRYDGAYRWFYGTAVPLHNDSGAIVKWYGSSTDINELKQAEAALVESENRFRQVTEGLPQLVWTCRADGSFDYLSPQWCTYTGIPEVPQLGIGWLAQLHPDDRERTISTWKTSSAQGDNLSIEFRIRRFDGEYRWFHTLAVPLRDDSGAIVKWFGSNTDIQDIKEAELALRESEARLHFALEMCNTGTWEVDLETHAAYRSIEHARIFGYADAESPWSIEIFLEHVVEEDRPRIAALINEAIRLGNELHFECRIRRIDGEIRWVMGAGRFRVTRLDGKKHVAVGIIQDITERNQAQQALELLNNELEERVKMRTAELATLNQSLEIFVYSVTHDLKTPLRGIDGYSRLLQEDFSDKLEGEGQLFLKHIREGILRMNELIDDLLAYSRMSSRNLDEVPVNITQLLENILHEYYAEINKKSVKIDIHLPVSNVNADKDGLALVLRNLIGNALKFSKHTPEPHICIGADQDENTVRLWIKDNGIGFDMKYADRIFEIFQRLHRLEDYPGTGIGLALVKTAIERMGGKVWAESHPGQGATFYVELKKLAIPA